MEYKYKNDEEKYFSYYLDELLDKGLITHFSYEEETFTLAEDVRFHYTKKTQLKTKLKIENKEKSLLKPITYTPDFIITGLNPNGYPFSSLTLEKNIPIFLLSGDEVRTYVDVKGTFAGRTNSTQYTFPIKQKWMYQKYGIYTNKIIPYKLFEQTFTPKKVMEAEVYKRDIPKRGIKMGDTKLKYELKTIEQWMKENK